MAEHYIVIISNYEIIIIKLKNNLLLKKIKFKYILTYTVCICFCNTIEESFYFNPSGNSFNSSLKKLQNCHI